MTTPNDVRNLFELKLKEGVPNPPGEFHPLDLERSKDDKYLKRILNHVDNDPKLAANMLWDILLWRKLVAANDINEDNMKMEYVKEGAFFPRGRDVDGRLLLVFKSKMHVKGQKDLEELKRVIIYWFDRVEREENGNPVSLFFDMENCGLSNMDMDLIKYLIMLMKLYYPSFLHMIIIYQMPWILNAAFKVVKSLLPAKAVEKMKFVTSSTLKDVVPLENALTDWGGMDNYTFKFIPENKNNSDNSQKKVTFAEQGDNRHSLGEMLRLNPNDVINFKSENDDVSGQFTITNMDESPISFKIRTTAPEKFRVRPSSGTLASGATQTVLIVVQSGFHLQSISKDRFLVMSVQIPKTDLTQQEVTEVWQKSTSSKIDEYRLKCSFPDNIPKNGDLSEAKNQGKSDSVTNALNNLQSNFEGIQKQVKLLKFYQFLTLILTSLAVLFGFLVYKNSNDDKYCERM